MFIWPPAASHRFMRRWRLLLLCCAGIFPSLSPSLLLYSRGLQSRKHVYESPLIHCHSALTPVCIPSLSYCSKQPCLTMTQTSCSLHYRYLLSTLSTLSTVSTLDVSPLPRSAREVRPCLVSAYLRMEGRASNTGITDPDLRCKL